MARSTRSLSSPSLPTPASDARPPEPASLGSVLILDGFDTEYPFAQIDCLGKHVSVLVGIPSGDRGEMQFEEAYHLERAHMIRNTDGSLTYTGHCRQLQETLMLDEEDAQVSVIWRSL